MPPANGERITLGADGKLRVPDRPVRPLHRGRRHRARALGAPRCGCSTRPSSEAYGGRRQIEWFEVFAGEKANAVYGPDTWLPEDTLEAFREYRVGIKGPLTTPVGGGVRSINVALRQQLDLYVCLRPVRWYPGVPSPVKQARSSWTW